MVMAMVMVRGDGRAGAGREKRGARRAVGGQGGRRGRGWVAGSGQGWKGGESETGRGLIGDGVLVRGSGGCSWRAGPGTHWAAEDKRTRGLKSIQDEIAGSLSERGAWAARRVAGWAAPASHSPVCPVQFVA